MDFTKVDKWIDDSYEQMVADLATIIKYPSVSVVDEETFATESDGAQENVSASNINSQKSPHPFGEDASASNILSQKSPHPFGENVSGALDAVLSICEREGLAIKNADGYYGYADFNGDKTDAELVGILGHMDVVPAPRETWTHEPFELTREVDTYNIEEKNSIKDDLGEKESNKDGHGKSGCERSEKLFGRGTIDDKGPMLSALYGLLALKNAGVTGGSTVYDGAGVTAGLTAGTGNVATAGLATGTGNVATAGLAADASAGETIPAFTPSKRLRFIFGTNEEVAMLGVREYIKHEELPARGFTPDADWPIIIGEKGIMQFSLSARWDNESESEDENVARGIEDECVTLESATNCATLESTKTHLKPDTKVATDTPRLISITAGTVSNAVPASAIATFSDGRVIRANGTTAHGSTPALGDNALTKLLKELSKIDFAPAKAKAFVDELAKIFVADDTKGTTLGIAGGDAVSENTATPTVMRLDENGGEVTIDCRFNLSDKIDKYETILSRFASERGWELKLAHCENPIYTKPDDPLVKNLLDAYKEVTGDEDAEPLIIGGGTYAKVMPNFVAFGMEPKDGPMRAHQSDEYITKDEFLTATKIYARAIYKIIV